MKQNRKRFSLSIEDPQQKIDEFYDPFDKQIGSHLKKQILKRRVVEYKCSVTLFADQEDDARDGIDTDDSSTHLSQNQPEVELNVMKPIDTNKGITLPFKVKTISKMQQISKQGVLSKIIQNTKNPKKASRLPDAAHHQNQQNFGFNSNFKVSYPQTPGFKSLLQSPFGKFNHLFKDIITTLSKQNEIQTDTRANNFENVQLDANPLSFYNKNKMAFDGAKYFIGISLKLKQFNLVPESLYFSNLACYAQPFSDKPWKKYVSLLEEHGKLNQACIVAKTAFLFTQNQQLIKSFLLDGQKCGYPLYKLQGIICSVSNPKAFQKTLLPESAKLQIKYGKSWKGVKVLSQICKANDHKLSVCLTVLFLARYLQNTGYQNQAMCLLRQSFAKSMSKLEIYLLYLEMSVRKNSYIVQSDLQEVLKYLDCISGENRYRFLLEISELLFKYGDQRYFMLLNSAFHNATDYCAPGTGCIKALKQIYYTVAKFLKICPPIKLFMNDQNVFQANRYKFINGHSLSQYEFSDWKYYLHYGVAKRHDILLQVSKKWPQTGRIIAEWIHCLRLVKKPLVMLRVWRQKIQQVPKSGQLWCEGGRIYAELGQYANASKCFKCAMHFTPQYGDSFIEELRLLLKDSRFLEIYRLKKLFLVSEPFYGHVLSYLRLNDWHNCGLTFNQIWQNAVYQISQDLYQQNVYERSKQKFRLFTAYPPYNKAYADPASKESRQKLFTSYEQMENKN